VSWKYVKLGSLVELITKGTTPTSVGYSFSEKGINFVKIESIDSVGNFLPNKFAKINAECNEALKRSQLKESDILFSIAGALGRTAVVTKEILPANTNQALAIIRLKDEYSISKEFLYRVLASEGIINQISQMKGGVAQQNLSLTQLKNFLVPLPSLQIQQKIVAKLDAIFAGIDKANAATVTNAKNAEALFQSYLTEVFERGGNCWNSYSLKQLGKVVTGNTPKTSDEENYGNFISFVKPGDFMVDGSIDLEKQKLSEVGMNKSRVVGKQSALMVCIGATIGKCGYTDVEIVTNQQINSITPTSNFSHKFIYYQMLTSDFQNLVKDCSGQATMPIINKSKWEALPMKFPPLAEQIEIVKKFDNLRIETQTLKIGLINKIEQLRLLKNSILRQAFNGELVKD
jgi:type I restriction enzyme S subunit